MMVSVDNQDAFFIGIPGELVCRSMLLEFLPPRDFTVFLAVNRYTKSLIPTCIEAILHRVFRGAHDGWLTWLKEKHIGYEKNLNLATWLWELHKVAQSGRFRCSSGVNHSVVLTPGGRVLSTGRGRHGALGLGSTMNSFLFQ
ncbi:unnamed protein product, partial [Choristocarpus tenellus]